MLKNKVVIVTGGGSGIGRATCVILAEAGARLVVADIDEASARENLRLVAEAGATGEARAFRADVSREEDVKAMVAFAEETYGRLDGAFNNAGIHMASKLPDELSAAEWKKVIDVDFTGVLLCVKYETALMRKTGGGAIVNNSSVVGLVGIPSGIEYVAANHGVVGITRGAACDAVSTGARVNAVMPGSIRTLFLEDAMKSLEFEHIYQAVIDRHTVGRLGEPEDVGYAVKWLLSDESSFINGVALPVDGGYTAR